LAAVLVDTNVLVYAHDRGVPTKQEQAIRLLEPGKSPATAA
jgi:predicted nucleic acid-binding protein